MSLNFNTRRKNQNSANEVFFSGKNNNIHSNSPYQNTYGLPQSHHQQTHTINRKNNRNSLFDNMFNNNKELNSILRRSKKNNTGVHPYILNNQRKRKQKHNQNNANREFFIGKNNNIHSNTPYQNTYGIPQSHHQQTHTINRKNNRNSLLDNNINNNLQNRLRSQGRKYNKKMNNNLNQFGSLSIPISQNNQNRMNQFIKNSRGPSQKEIEESFVYSPEQQLRRYEVPFYSNNLNRKTKRKSVRKTKKRRPRKNSSSLYNSNVSNYVVLNSEKVKRAKKWNSIKNTGRKISNRTKRGFSFIKRSGKKFSNRIKKSFKKSNKNSNKKKAELNNHIKKLETKIDQLSNEQVSIWARDGPQVLGEGTALLRAAPSKITDLLVRARLKLDELRQERNNLNTNGGRAVYQ